MRKTRERGKIMLHNITLTSFLNGLDKLHKGYSYTILSNGRARVLYNNWFYYFDNNEIFWYKVPIEEVK